MKTPKKRKPARKKPASKRSEDHARITWALGGGAAGGGGIGGNGTRWTSTSQAVRIGRDVVFAALGAAIAMLLTAWLQP